MRNSEDKTSSEFFCKKSIDKWKKLLYYQTVLIEIAQLVQFAGGDTP